jgi:hypothetical protein
LNRAKAIVAISRLLDTVRIGRPSALNRDHFVFLVQPVVQVEIIFDFMTFVPVFQGLVGMMFGLAERMFLAADGFGHGFDCLHHNFSYRRFDSFNNANSVNGNMRVKSRFHLKFKGQRVARLKQLSQKIAALMRRPLFAGIRQPEANTL